MLLLFHLLGMFAGESIARGIQTFFLPISGKEERFLWKMRSYPKSAKRTKNSFLVQDVMRQSRARSKVCLRAQMVQLGENTTLIASTYVL
jgi:hypothetical protein